MQAIYAYAYVCIDVSNLFPNMDIHPYACMCIHMYASTHICRSMHVHAYADMRTYTYETKFVPVHAYVCICTCMPALVWSAKNGLYPLCYFGVPQALSLVPDAYIYCHVSMNVGYYGCIRSSRNELQINLK